MVTGVNVTAKIAIQFSVDYEDGDVMNITFPTEGYLVSGKFTPGAGLKATTTGTVYSNVVSVGLGFSGIVNNTIGFEITFTTSQTVSVSDQTLPIVFSTFSSSLLAK